jgi:hypothetical protein
MNGATGNKTRILHHEVEARCFNLDGIEQMEAVTRDHSRNSVMDYNKFFSRFVRNTNPSVFGAPCQDTHVSVEHTVSETLRLYPPTLRMHCKPQPEMVKIEIEFLHGDQITWERDGSAFRPERWEAVLFKGLNGRIAFSRFEPGELSVRKRSLRRWSLGSWLER